MHAAGSKQVLYVERDSDDALAFEKGMRAFGISVVVVRTMEEAIVRLGSGRCDVLVVTEEPSESGICENLRQFFEKGIDLPLVVLDSAPSQARAAESIQMGAHDYLPKDDDGIYLKTLPVAINRSLAARPAKRGQECASQGNLSSEDRYARGILQASIDMIVSVDTNRKIVEFNKAAEKTFGYKKEEVFGKNVEVLYADSSQGVRVRDALLSDGEFRGEVLNRRKDGEVFSSFLSSSVLTDAAGNTLGFMGVSRDISERKRLEEELRGSETMYRRLVEDANSIILRMDSKGNVLFLNEYAQSYFGFSQEDILGRNVVGTIVPKTDSGGLNLEEMILDIGLNPERYAINENENVRSNGDSVWIAWTNRPVYDEAGCVKEILCVGRDLTDRKRAGEALAARERQQAVVAKLGQRALAGESLSALFDVVVTSVAETLDVEYCKVLELLPDGEEMLLRAGVGWDEGLVGNTTVSTSAESHTGYTLHSKAPVVIDDLGADSRFSASQLLVDHKVVSGVSVIVGKPTSVWGVLAIHSSRKKEFSGNDINFLHAVANLLASTISRSRSEQTLRQLSTAVEQSPASIVITDSSGDIEYVNPKFVELTGYSPDEVMGKNPRILKSGRQGEDLYQNMWETITSGEAWRGEFYNKKKNGEFYWESASLSPMKANDGTITNFIAVKEDITIRKEMEAELEESRAFLQTIIDAIDDHLLVIDLDYRVLLMNRVAREDVEKRGLNPACATCHQVSHGSDTPCELELHPCPLETVVETGRTFTTFHTHFDHEGKEGIVEVVAAPILDRGGKVIQVVERCRDITERRRSEEALQKSEEMLRAITSSARDAIVMMDQEGAISFWNEASERLFGYTFEEVLGKDLHSTLAPGSYREANSKALPGFLKTGRGPVIGTNLEVEGLHKDGTEIPLELSVSALRLHDQWHAVAVIRDVTERKRGEELLQKAKDELETRVIERTESLRASNERLNREIEEHKRTQHQLTQSQKMEVVGQLAGGVAHDFNNMLSAVLGYTDLACGALEADSPIASHLGQVRLAGERAAALTRQLLAFSRRQILQPKDLDLNDLIANLLKMVHRVIGEHIELDFAPGHNLGTVHVDPGQVEQVILNLCVNARDAMPDGGMLRIATANRIVDAESCRDYSWVTPGPHVLLRVVDNGCGIERDVLEQIFEPFFTTKEVGKGTGLGLATASGVVNQHNGMIQVQSEVGKGTEFVLYWPVVDRAPAEASESEDSAAPVGGTETVLVVEDDRIVRTLSTHILEHAGYAVLSAGDGNEALRTFKIHLEKIDLILLDVVMPGLGGQEVYDAVREIAPETRVLFYSGYSESALHNQFILNEGLHLIQKPISRNSLLRKVREVLDEG